MSGTAGRITDIREDHRGSKLRRILIDDEEFVTTSVDVVRDLSLSVDDMVDLGDLRIRIVEAEPFAARARALRILNARDRSVGEIADRLTGDGYPETLARRVADDFADRALVDDTRLAASLVASLGTARRYGRARVLRDLRRRRIPEEIALTALDEGLSPEEEEDNALVVARQHATPVSDPEKLAQRLVRRGYSWRTARKAVDQALSKR